MIIEVSMKSDTDKMSVCSWWCTSPGFALGALIRQLQVAQTIWPEELNKFAIRSDCTITPEPPPLPAGEVTTTDGLTEDDLAKMFLSAIVADRKGEYDVFDAARDFLKKYYVFPRGAGAASAPNAEE